MLVANFDCEFVADWQFSEKRFKACEELCSRREDRTIEITLSEAEDYYGGAAIVLEGLADAYVVTPVEQEGLPTIYPQTRKVSINRFVVVKHTDDIVP
jgi:hypothetical protein